jgi:hypothetical protein
VRPARKSKLGIMSGSIASNSNRFYCATEAQYGRAATVTAANRFPAVKMQAHQALVASRRRDKTGSRTFRGVSPHGRRASAFDVRTYLTSWNAPNQPSYGPLFQGAMGGTPQMSSNLVVAAAPSGGTVQTTGGHGLSVGSAVSYSGEIRFVTAVPDSVTVVLNAPFSSIPVATSPLAPVINYGLATALPSITLYDYWDPAGAVSRIITGAATNTATVTVNGDFHEFLFSGPASDLLDSSNTRFGTTGLAAFPTEPQLGTFDYSIVPGHLGQVWLGSAAAQFFTLTSAVIEIKNNVSLRNQEFGSVYPTALVPGEREVNVHFTLFAQDDAQSIALYSAAKLRTPISAMLQLGQQQGQLLGIYLPNVVPEIPEYLDSDTRLQWHFNNCLSQGTSNDELYLAFA